MTRKMIDPNLAGQSVGKQGALLSTSRSSFYYEPKGESEMNLDLIRVTDKHLIETPFDRVRQMPWQLRNEDHLVNEKRIRRLMRLIGLMPICQKPNTSKVAKGHKIYPNRLQELRVDQPNLVWWADPLFMVHRPARSDDLAGMVRETNGPKAPCLRVQSGNIGSLCYSAARIGLSGTGTCSSSSGSAQMNSGALIRRASRAKAQSCAA